MVMPPSEKSAAAANAARRLRVRNWAMFVVLIGLFAVIYAVTLVKGHH